MSTIINDNNKKLVLANSRNVQKENEGKIWERFYETGQKIRSVKNKIYLGKIVNESGYNYILDSGNTIIKLGENFSDRDSNLATRNHFQEKMIK